MKAPDKTTTIKLIEENGNAYSIMGKTIKALKQAGADKEYTDKYMNKAMSGDYGHLLGVTMERDNGVCKC